MYRILPIFATALFVSIFGMLQAESKTSTGKNLNSAKEDKVLLAEFSELVLEKMGARYKAADRLPSELKYRVNSNSDGEGVILIGKLHEPDAVAVSRQVTIEEDGSFATAVASGKELIFYAHGHRPLVVEPANLIEGPLYDVGELSFEPLPKEERPELTLIAVTHNTRFEQEIEARLILERCASLSRSGGTWQGWAEPVVEKRTIKHGERVTFSGLGLNPYRLELWADGYVVHSVDVQPESENDIDLGALVVEPAKKLRIRFLGNFDLEDSDAWPEISTTEIVANGKAQFVFNRYKHPKGYYKTSKMRLKPDGSQVEIYYPVIPSEYYDLGEGIISSFIDDRQWLDGLESHKVQRPIHLRSGHVYFFQNKRREANCLFEVKVIEE